jgi:hypothetical protein
METTNIPWRPKEDTEIHTVQGKGSSRKKKEMKKKNKNEKQGGLCGVELFYFS